MGKLSDAFKWDGYGLKGFYGGNLGILEDPGKYLLNWALSPDIPEQEKGIVQTFASPDAKFPVIYGTQGKVSGVIVFQETNDADGDDIKNDLLHMIIVWSEGQCKSIDQIYIDGIAVTDDRFKVEGESTYWAYARNFPNGMGTYTDAHLTAAGWRASDKLEGKACTYLRCEYTEQEDVWTGFPQVTADISGRMISTPAGGALTNSENPVDVLYEYLKNEIYGKGLTTTDIDFASFTAQRPTAIIQIEETTGGGIYRDNFTCNVSLSTDTSVLDNVNIALKPMRAWLPVIDGKLSLVIEKDDTTADFALTEDNIIVLGAVKNSSKSNRYNRVIVKYIDPDAEWEFQEAIYPELASQTETDLLAEDNGIVLEKSITLKTCTNFYEAKAFAKTVLEISREQLRTTVLCEPEASILTVGDIIPVTHSYPGWTAKLFRVDSTSEDLATGETRLQLREHQPYIYDFANTGLKPSIPDTTITYDRPATPTVLSSATINSELIQNTITWSGTTTKYEVSIYNASDELIINEIISRKEYSVRNLDTATYDFQVRAIGGLGRKSDWATLSFSVTDKTYYTWRVYADDIDGLNISTTASTKPFVGYAFDKLTATPDITDASIYGFFPNTAAQFLIGTGVPASGLGNVGDTYIDQSSGDIYTKTGAGWGSAVGNFAPGDGDSWLSGTVAPSNGDGADGDWYINTTNYDLYQKVAGVWEARGTIQGGVGPSGEDGISKLPAAIAPALLGGSGDLVVNLNMLSAVTSNDGEVYIAGTRFYHPDGTLRTVTAQTVHTQYGDGGSVSGIFYIMWSDTLSHTRYPTLVATNFDNGNFVHVKYSGTEWLAVNNTGVTTPANLAATDCFIAAIEAEATTGGLTSLFMFTGGAFGIDGAAGIDGIDGADGGDGNSTAQITVFKRAASAPATPTGGSFNFTTGALTLPSGWFSAIPAGTDPVYTSHGLAFINGATGTDSSIPWTSPELTIQNGTDGTNGADGAPGRSIYQATVFRRGTSTPATPTGGSYDFGANSQTPPAGWSTSLPSGTDPVYISIATYTIIGTTGTDSSPSWTFPALASESGIDGLDGVSSYLYQIFKRAASLPANPTGGSFNFGTNTGTPPAGWSNTIVDGTNPIYTSSALASITGDTGTDSTLTWASSALSAKSGTDGNDGFNGLDGSYKTFIYKLVTDGSGTPATPTGGTFNGTTETIPSGWTDNPTFGGVGVEYISESRYNQQSGGSWTRSPDWSTASIFAIRGGTGPTGPVGPSAPVNGTTMKDEDNVNVVAGTTVVCSITLTAGTWDLRAVGVFIVESSSGSRTGSIKVFRDGSQVDIDSGSGAILDLEIDYTSNGYVVASGTEAFQIEVTLDSNADTATADAYVQAISA